MKPDLKPFVEAVREKDIKRAKEKLEEITRGLDPNDGFWKGYRLALHGIVAAVEAGDELTVIKRIINGGCARQHIQELLNQAKARRSDVFRPKDERGFDTAWADVLRIFVSETRGT